MTTPTTTELREAIKATLRRRSPKAVSVMLVCELGDVEREITETIDNSPDEDVGYIADLLGLRPDGSDPVEDVRRVTAERDEGIDRLRLADQLWRVHLAQLSASIRHEREVRAARRADAAWIGFDRCESKAELDAEATTSEVLKAIEVDMTGEWAGRVTIAERITKAETCLAQLSAAIRYEREVRPVWRPLIADGSSNKGLADAALASVENTTGEALKAIEAAQ